MSNKRVFLSYGHDQYSFIVERFAKQFSSLYEDVFFDRWSIDTGVQYDNKIEKAIELCDVVIFFMTKYSVRINNTGLTNAYDSFCRDEIGYARSCRKSIIPVMLEDCQPPLIVHRLQFINGKNIFISNNKLNDDKFETVKEQLIDIIEDINKLHQYGESYSLMQALNQFDSDAYSKGFTRDFTGRKWLTQKCISWIKSENEKVLCIIGEIGSGKSSFVTNLVYNDNEGYFVGLHYCRFEIESSTKVRNIVKSLTYAVATQLTGFSHYIEGISERVLDSASGTELFEKLLVEPLHKINVSKDKKVVIVIDAIDEISSLSEKDELMKILSENSRYLPDWFKIIVTSRPDSKLEYLLQDTTIIKIDTSSKENVDDICNYIDEFAEARNIKISENEKEMLVKGSNGNFLYVYFALSDLLESGIQIKEYNKYPKGLDGIYARTISHKFNNIEEYEEQIVPIFEILCATKAPISLNDLAKIIGEKVRILLFRIQCISAFIRMDGDTLCFYHKSLAEWLIDWTKSGEYFIESINGRNKIVNWMKDSSNDFTSSKYCMLYGVDHLIENKEYIFLNHLLQDKQFSVAEKYSTVLLEYVYRKQLEIVEKVIENICAQPSIVSFVVIRRLVSGAINAGKFEDAIYINELQKSILPYKPFYYTGYGNIVLYHHKDIQQACQIYTSGLNLSEENCKQENTMWNNFTLSVFLGRMGKIMVESLKMEEAMSYYQKFLDLSIKLYDETKSIEILRNIAIGYERLGWILQNNKKYKEALEQYNSCLLESQKIYDATKTVEALRGVAITYERLGRVAEITGEYDKAIDFYMNNYTMSNDVYKQMGVVNSKRGLANSCHCLGDAYLAQENYRSALVWFQKDKQISSEIYTVTGMIDDIRDYAVCLDRLAFTQDMLKNSAEAEDLFSESVNMYHSLIKNVNTQKLINEFVVEYVRIIEFYLFHNNYDKAKNSIHDMENCINISQINSDLSNHIIFLKNCVLSQTCLKKYGEYCNRRNTK